MKRNINNFQRDKNTPLHTPGNFPADDHPDNQGFLNAPLNASSKKDGDAG